MVGLPFLPLSRNGRSLQRSEGIYSVLPRRLERTLRLQEYRKLILDRWLGSKNLPYRKRMVFTILHSSVSHHPVLLQGNDVTHLICVSKITRGTRTYRVKDVKTHLSTNKVCLLYTKGAIMYTMNTIWNPNTFLQCFWYFTTRTLRIFT